MVILQQKIFEAFLSKLADTKKIDPEKLEQIKALLSADKKPKVEDFVNIFQTPVEGNHK